MKRKFKPRDFFPGWSLVEYLLLRGFAALVNGLPVTVSTWIARSMGGFVFFLLPKRKRVALGNLTIAYGDSLTVPEKEKIAQESVRNFATSLMEFFRMPSMIEEAQKRFEFEGTEILDHVFAKGKGAILVISHLGSWEYLGFLPYLKGYPCSVVVRETRNPYIYKWIQQLRMETNLNPIPKKSAVRGILSELKKNHLVAILIDQWAGREGVIVDLFNKPTRTTSIPVRLAKRTGAALVPGYCLRTAPGKYKIIIRPEISVEGNSDWEQATTQKLNRSLEKEILAYPQQWIWTHQRWKHLS
ncbi:MAG: lysophospholipid acyltransferase family protein [Candidatus Omnitrophica bacterium]|nr:lysophospholipid acyltransferase family protein [Candidatus Omnitrophota bacterium]